MVSALAVSSLEGPGAAPRLSPTLYFADSAAEASDRAALHDRVDPLGRAIAAADSVALAQRLAEANRAIVALQRHAAYLKVRALENVDDRAAKDALTSVGTDQSVLTTAMVTRLQRVTPNQIASLGKYAKLARDAQHSAAQRLTPEAERYRGAVTLATLQSISDAYDARIATLRGFGPIGSPDLTTRRAALARREAAFDSAAPAMATLLGTLIDLENRDAAAHGFRNAAERKYSSLGLSDTLVDRTLAAVAAEAPVYRRYQQLFAERAARRLGVSPILSAERNIGLPTATALSFGEGMRLILDALAPLGADYVNRFHRLLDPNGGRLDLSGGPHRANTGTSIVAYDAPVALYLTTFNGSLPNLSTIAHEGGHAIHRELMSADSLPVYLQTGPHDLFEGYAIFNEWLVLDHASKTASTAADRERALEALLTSMAIEIFTSAEETSFEKSLYTSSVHGILDRGRIDEMYRASIAPYQYWPTSDVATSTAWMTKPLLFQDPLYLVNYLYASFVAVALWDRAESDPDFSRKYEALLRRGFDADPDVLLASIGVRLGDPAVIRRASALFKAKTDELEALYAAADQR